MELPPCIDHPSALNDLPEGFVQNHAVQQDVIRYISSFDESIVDFEIEEIRKSDENVFGKTYVIHTIHKLENGGYQSILLKNESNGTRKMLALYRPLRFVLDHGGTIFIDEMNDRLHPLLGRNIILTFLSPATNPNHAQIIFTTHDVWQFTNELLRRDELWVTSKDKNGVSTLYSVAEFKDEDGNKIRKNSALARNYLVGSYGGIPELKPLFRIGDDADDKQAEAELYRFASLPLALFYCPFDKWGFLCYTSLSDQVPHSHGNGTAGGPLGSPLIFYFHRGV